MTSSSPEAMPLPAAELGMGLLRFALVATWRHQAVILCATLASLPFYYLSLDFAKALINRVFVAHIRDEAVSVQVFGIKSYTAAAGTLLLELSAAFLGSILVYEVLKTGVNIYKGVLAERVVAYLRRTLLALAGDSPRGPSSAFGGRLMPMVVSEPEPIGGICGDLVALPAIEGGLLVTALVFIFVQNVALGLAASILFPLQLLVFPKLVARRTSLELEWVEHIRVFSQQIESEIDRGEAGAPASQPSALPTTAMAERVETIRRNRTAMYVNKFVTYFFLNFANQFTPFLFYAIGGWFVLEGRLSVGALVGAIAAYRDLTPPWKELLYWWQDCKMVVGRYGSLMRQFET